jgi:hypothetical protein
MTKNILSLDDFKNKKKSILENVEDTVEETKVEESTEETTEEVNEMVEAIDDFYRVSYDYDLPKSLISSYIKKVKESAGKDLRVEMGEKKLAEVLVQWVFKNYVNIENLPVEIVVGSDKSPVQTQVQSQPEEDVQDFETQPQVQPQGQAQVQPQAQGQAQGQAQAQPQIQEPGGQGQAQIAAQEIPAQEI